MAENQPAVQEETVTLGDKSVELSTFDRYKGRKGVTDLVAFTSSVLIKANTHYSMNKTFRCISSKDNRAICCVNAGEPTQKFGLVVFQYSVDENGALIDPARCSGKVKLWILTESKYDELSNVHKQWPLLDIPAAFTTPQHDLIVKCTEEQYQKMTYTPTPKSHWKSQQAWYDVIKAKTVKATERLRLAMGRHMTEVEIRELFGQSAPVTGSTQNSGDLDLGDVLET